ncbi:hypothetical protein POUND7_005114 [Theobroma cacao]
MVAQKELRSLNLSTSRFQFKVQAMNDYTLFNCSSMERHQLYSHIPCLDVPGYEVYSLNSVDDISKYPLSSCTKLYSGSYPDGMFLDILPLKWTEPMCGFCEQNGKHCRLKNDSTVAQIERFDAPIKAKGTKGTMRKLVTAGVVLGSRLVVIAIIAVYYLYSSNKMRKENDAKIEKFLEDHRSLKPSRPYTNESKYACKKRSPRIGSHFRNRVMIIGKERYSIINYVQARIPGES